MPLAMALALTLTSCTSATDDSPHTAQTSTPATTTAPSSGQTSETPAPPVAPGQSTAPSGQSTVPPGQSTVPPGQSTVPPSSSDLASPTYFTPKDPANFAMSGRVAVEQARQDPFSNLLQRGALHDHPVTLDVVGTPDYPVTPGQSSTVLLGTCKCDQRGSGLRLTVPGSAVTRAGDGDVIIRGTFTVTVTASDAMTLTAAG